MFPVTPVLHDPDGHLMTFGTGQPEYLPLHASVGADGKVVTEWELTAEELACLVCGGRVRLTVITYDEDIGTAGHGLQPVKIEAIAPLSTTKES